MCLPYYYPISGVNIIPRAIAILTALPRTSFPEATPVRAPTKVVADAVPVVVISEDPVSIVPKPEVIEPAFNAPTEVICVCAASTLSVFVERVRPVPPTSAVLLIAIAASDLTSAFTITSLAIEVALPEEVTSPVKFALVVTDPAVKPEAVPVQLVKTPEAGVPSAGVTSVGELDNTTFVLPVEDVTPVPPCATATVVPSQVPVAIVPTEVI